MSGAEVFVVAAARTPIGAFQGALAPLPATRLGAAAIRGALAQASLPAERVDAVIMGNVLTSGAGQAPARQAALYAGLPERVAATTVGKVCGSGLEALLSAVRSIKVGDAEVVVAGGMESMSNAPYLLPKARTGQRLGHGELLDALLHDGLWDPYGDFHMAEAAEAVARAHGLGRAEQDDYARRSYERARASQRTGAFAREIVPVVVPRANGEQEVTEDEEPQRVNLEKLTRLAPVFVADGSITAGNASKLNDGAAALVLTSGELLAQERLEPLARVVAYAGHAQAPAQFATAPVQAVRRVLARAGLTLADIDLFEINEAFAAVALLCARELSLPLERVNVQGGAVALGHPIGATGARLVATLVHMLHARGARRGLATICIGGGEALALIVERP